MSGPLSHPADGRGDTWEGLTATYAVALPVEGRMVLVPRQLVSCVFQYLIVIVLEWGDELSLKLCKTMSTAHSAVLSKHMALGL